MLLEDNTTSSDGGDEFDHGGGGGVQMVDGDQPLAKVLGDFYELMQHLRSQEAEDNLLGLSNDNGKSSSGGGSSSSNSKTQRQQLQHFIQQQQQQLESSFRGLGEDESVYEYQQQQQQQQQRVDQNMSIDEVDLLRRNNVSLLEALAEERQMRSKAERSLRLAKDEVEMAERAGEAEVESYRLAAIRLQGQVRLLAEERSLEEVYVAIEADVMRLQKEVQTLRQRNVLLETRDLEMLEQREKEKEEAAMQTAVRNELDVSAESLHDVASSPIHAITNAVAPSSSSGSLGMSKRDAKRLFARLRQQGQELESMWKEIESLRSSERRHALSLQQAKDAARRLHLAAQTSIKQKAQLEAEHKAHAATARALAAVQGEVSTLHTEEQRLREQLQASVDEVASYRHQLLICEERIRKAMRIESFVQKHGSLPPNRDMSTLLNVTRRDLPRRPSSATNNDYSTIMGNSSQHHHLHMTNTGSPSQHQYLSKNDNTPSASWERLAAEEEKEVNDAMNELRALITCTNPTLLPLLRRLGKGIREEREKRNSHFLSPHGPGSSRRKAQGLATSTRQVGFN